MNLRASNSSVFILKAIKLQIEKFLN